jgi:hypothetical protein
VQEFRRLGRAGGNFHFASIIALLRLFAVLLKVVSYFRLRRISLWLRRPTGGLLLGRKLLNNPGGCFPNLQGFSPHGFDRIRFVLA